MKQALEPFEPAKYLKTPEEVDEFLHAAGETNDPGHMLRALAVAAKARNMRALADEVSMSRAGLYKALENGGNPSFMTVSKLAAALGYRLTLEKQHSA